MAPSEIQGNGSTTETECSSQESLGDSSAVPVASNKQKQQEQQQTPLDDKQAQGCHEQQEHSREQGEGQE
eukprot:scaffold175517_cov24-Tisochrysis_lutea.AAC.1